MATLLLPLLTIYNVSTYCRLGFMGQRCPAIRKDGACPVYFPEGVRLRNWRLGKCDFKDIRTDDPTMRQKATKTRVGQQKQAPKRKAKSGEIEVTT